MTRLQTLFALIFAIGISVQEVAAETQTHYPNSDEQAQLAVEAILAAVDEHNKAVDEEEQAEIVTEIINEIGEEELSELAKDIGDLKSKFAKLKKRKGITSSRESSDNSSNPISSERPDEKTDPFVEKFKDKKYKAGDKHVFIVSDEKEIWVFISRDPANEDKLTVTVLNVDID